MIRYDWEDVNRAVVGLYIQIQRKLADDHKILKAIVGIHRGGLIPAVMMSHCFFDSTVQMIPLRWQTRDQTKYTDSETLCKIVYGCKRREAILIVDDIADSGKTFNDIHRHISFCNAINPASIYYAALIEKSTAKLDMPILSHTFTDSDGWVYFPWEAG